MELILKEDVIGLGYKNDIVNVKSGYGRNYLIPTGKAVIASPSARKVLAENLRQQAVKLAKVKADAEALAEKIGALHLTVVAKVSSTGTIYGSVNSLIISEELDKAGFQVDRKLIKVADVKAVGDYTAVVRLHKEVSVEVPFTVVAENAPVEEVAEAPAVEAPATEAPATEAPATEAPATEAPAEEA